MGKILILGNDSAERVGLAVALEFAGNRCFPAGSLQEAVNLLKKESYDLVLANPPISDGSWVQAVKALKAISPRITVILLSEDADSASGADEVITLPYSPVGNLSPQFSEIGKSQALLVLLPEEESLRRWSGLPETPGMLNKLAVLYHFQEKYATAERLYKRALRISERKFGHQHHKVATILNNLARLYHDQDRYADAGTLYKRSLAIVKKVFGASHAKVARRLSNLAELDRAQSRQKELSIIPSGKHGPSSVHRPDARHSPPSGGVSSTPQGSSSSSSPTRAKKITSRR